ncbi:DUF5686 and carboxypeptidase-like regulatory domain-containing protein [Pontibacter mangrovi]|uniref:Carboxypeptidase-like regulatory domain-containing protein n=1 Tax=Pontibacter mangrovi TaxID=2589816 RepID=A0A501W407_9BACT|nr:DUF5686 and carboxypeptidase-like regulatory domain-containing protein [Pontibacter mangrovi]TPE43365.1 carboxypeptidase-like regulatory domain-containing protein [Pontibacter mangrovi]
MCFISFLNRRPCVRLFCLLLLVFTGLAAGPAAAQPSITTIKGNVTDAVTNERLIGVSVFVPGTSLGTSTDYEGNYQLRTNQAVSKVQFSYLGYGPVALPVSPGKDQTLDVRLQPDARQLSEVQVVGKKRKVKYSNKDNPAVDLIRLIVDNKYKNRPERYDYLQYVQYEKTQMSLVNTPAKLRRNIFLRKYDFILENLDTTVLPGKAILPFYVQEEVAQHFFRKEPESRKKLVEAEKKVNFGEYIDNKGVMAYMKHMYQDIDIYENNIPILTNQFLSPIADMAPAFYKFYLKDTVTAETGQKLAKLLFEPRNPTAFMFTGELYVTLDGAYAVQRVDMAVSKGVSINWVRDLKVSQDFERGQDGRYQLSKSQLKVDFGMSQHSDMGFYGERVVSYQDYKLHEPQPDAFYDGPALVLSQHTEQQSEAYWESVRQDSLSAAEANTYTTLDSLVQMKSYNRTMDWATALIAGYKRLGPDVEIGPINAFYSFNPVEGFRLRLGGRTTDNFSKKVMLDAYTAYGFKDEKWKYYVGGSYSLTGRSVWSFPVKALRVSYLKDTRIPGQDLQFVQEDNILLSFKRGENDKLLYNETYNLEYLHEFENHFSYKLGFRNWQQSPAGSLQFVRAGEAGDDQEPAMLSNLTTSEATLELRWAPNEQFLQGKLYRTPVSGRNPVVTLRAAAGLKGAMDSQYAYQKVALNMYKRFYLSQLGYSDVVAEGGYIFGQVPFPLLTIHRANQSYAYQLQAYNLMNFLEFVSDQYASLHIDHTFNGFIFNKIPLLKKTKFREFITLKALYGKVREENQPSANPNVLHFPVFADGQQATYTLARKPYIETSVGVGNILNFFRVDLVKRLTYLNHPNVSDLGVRATFKFDF